MRADSVNKPWLGLTCCHRSRGKEEEVWHPYRYESKIRSSQKRDEQHWIIMTGDKNWAHPWAFNVSTSSVRWLQWKRGLFIYLINMIDCWHSPVLPPTPGNTAFVRWSRLVTKHTSPRSDVSSSVAPLRFPVAVSSVGCWNLSFLVAALCRTGSFQCWDFLCNARRVLLFLELFIVNGKFETLKVFYDFYFTQFLSCFRRKEIFDFL